MPRAPIRRRRRGSRSKCTPRSSGHSTSSRSGIDSWWPRDHRVGPVEMASAVLEPRAGGRWYEVGVDGTTIDWGLVLAWDPPRHVAMSWHLDGDFRHDADRNAASRVDVFFEAVDPTSTTVTLVH